MNIKKCKICLKKFETHNKKAVVCSKNCYGKYRSKFFTGKNSSNWQGGKEKTKKKCLVCAGNFEAKWKRKFCSFKCSNKFKSLELRGERAPQWKGGLCKQKKKCKNCNKNFIGYRTRLFCSKSCQASWKSKGEKNVNWNGGKTGGNGNYVYILMPNHPDADKSGYILEHRLKMESNIGRRIKKSEVVHHVNCKKDDNRIENLQLMEKREHDRYHTKLRHQTNKLFK